MTKIQNQISLTKKWPHQQSLLVRRPLLGLKACPRASRSSSEVSMRLAASSLTQNQHSRSSKKLKWEPSKRDTKGKLWNFSRAAEQLRRNIINGWRKNSIWLFLPASCSRSTGDQNCCFSSCCSFKTKLQIDKISCC